MFRNQPNGAAGLIAAAASEQTYASTWGTAAFAPGQTYLPELKAYASAGLGKEADTTSFAAQMFTYSGDAPRTVSLLINLTGSVSNNASGYAYNAISASMAVLRGDIPWYPNFGSLVYEAVPAQNRLAVGDAFINTPGVTSVPTTLQFNLMPGDSFYVVTQLYAVAQNGVADASHTLAMRFDNAAGLTAVTAVPELGTAWLAGAGLLMLAARTWRQRVAR